MLTLGLSGGIGAGKSTVSRALADRGAVVVDADLIAREVVEPGTPGLAAVAARFGAGILTAEGRLDRAAMARRVFGDPAARQALNAVVHPLVRARSAELQAAAPRDAVVVHDVPLLVENGMGASFPLVVVVHADEQVRLERLVQARGMHPDDALARMRAQATDGARRAAADVWLDNSGGPEALAEQVEHLWTRLQGFERNLRRGRAAVRPRRAQLVGADPVWADEGRRLVERLTRLLGADAVRVDHIGSTSVPGLGAKDVIDVQVVVESVAAAEQVGPRLTAVGLVPRRGLRWDRSGDREAHPKVMARNADPARAVNVHVRPAISPWWREALLLREWLRANPHEAAAYEAHKREAACRTRDVDAYSEAKSPWLAAALRRAADWSAARLPEAVAR